MTEDLAYGLGAVVSLVTRSVFGPLGPLLGGLVSGWFLEHPTWSYVPDLGQMFSAYPEQTILLVLGFFLKNTHNMPVKTYMRRTSGRLVPELRYTFFDLPERCILLMHHRRHHHPGLTVQEFHDLFYMLPDSVPFKIIVSRGWKKDLVSKGMKVVEERLYNAIDVRHCSKIDGSSDPHCVYKLYEPFKTPGPLILVVFPDKFGAQYYGDRSMFYRKGAFAAAIAAGVPLVDTLSMYPTFAHQYHTAKTTRVVFPNSTWPLSSLDFDKDSFQAFTETHSKEIEALRVQMQDLFLSDVATEESKIGSCDKDISIVTDESGPLCSRCVYVNGPLRVSCQKV